MPGQVRLNLPPRLIESARAAQYANRAALDARVLDEKVEAKAVQRHAAIQRAQPLPDARVGGVLEFSKREVRRIWTRRRALAGVDMAVGWEQQVSAATAPTVAIAHANDWTATTRLSGVDTASGVLTFVALLGSGDGSQWDQVTASLPWSYQLSYALSTAFPSGAMQGYSAFALAESRQFRRVVVTLPLSDNRLLWLMAVGQFTLTRSLAAWGAEQVAVTTAVPFFAARIVGEQSVEPLTASVPAFVLSEIQAAATALQQGLDPLGGVLSQETGAYHVRPTRDSFAWGLPHTTTAVNGFSVDNAERSIGINPAGLSGGEFRLVSSAAYDGLTVYAGQAMTGAQAKAALKAYNGSAEIPVVAYKRDRRALPYPENERGVFGVQPGVSVTDAVFPAVTALDDELDRSPASGVIAPGGPHTMLIGYDYHGGTYCRDKLQALGITLP